jgi:oxygen-independent coproporphyrinogen-3 oxidase
VNPLAVYVHIPFCTVKCGYCDFNAYAGMGALAPAYEDALLAEIAAWAPRLRGREVATVSFGGGTPGEFQASGIAAVVRAVAAFGALAPGAEVSLEANPGSTTRGCLDELRSAGITRISFGAQSFDPGELRFLDRIHSPEATVASVGLAREAAFQSVNIDLIYGLPGQSCAAWERSLRRAIALDVDHISCYGLTVEEGTPLARKVANGEVEPLDPDIAAGMYELACELLAAAGFIHYEISNWARPGHESRHNLVYWTDGEYLGIGAGAHGYLDGQRYENVPHPRDYISRALGRPANGEAMPGTVLNAYRPDPRTAMFDWLETAFRLVDGFDPRRFASRFGRSLEDAAGLPLSECRDGGLIEDGPGGFIRLTPRGWLLHSEVCARILAHLNQVRPAVPSRDR